MRRALITSLSGLTIAGVALADPGITVTPSIGLQEAYTDSAAGSQKSLPDVATQISPGVIIAGESARTKINFTYVPTFNHFNLGTSPDRIDHTLDGTATVTPLTDQLAIDFKANANEAGASGNSSNQQGILIPDANRVLYYLGSVTPHLSERLGDFGTLDVIYELNSSNTSVQGQSIPGLGINSTNSLAQTGEVVIGSADTFGRLGLKLDFRHTGTTGSGMNTESTDDADTLGGTYHFTRIYALTGTVGYEATDYPATSDMLAYHDSGLTWNIGASFTPNDQSAVTVGYGFQQGAYNPNIQINYALGPRTSVTASYLVSIQNQLTTVGQTLQFLGHDQFGNPIDIRTGLPFNPVNQTFGSQNALFRDKPALLSITHSFVRSSIGLTAQYEVRSSLTGPLSRSSTTGASINYSREFTPLLQGTFNIGYTDSDSTGFGALTTSVQSISLSASLFYRLSETTTVSIIENYFKAMSNTPDGGSKTQQLTIGLRKSF